MRINSPRLADMAQKGKQDKASTLKGHAQTYKHQQAVSACKHARVMKGGAARRGGATAVQPINPHQYKCWGQNYHDNCRPNTKHLESHWELTESLRTLGLNPLLVSCCIPGSAYASIFYLKVREHWTKQDKEAKYKCKAAKKCPGSIFCLKVLA